MNIEQLDSAIADAERLLRSGNIPSFVLNEVCTIYALAVIKRIAIKSKEQGKETP